MMEELYIVSFHPFYPTYLETYEKALPTKTRKGRNPNNP